MMMMMMMMTMTMTTTTVPFALFELQLVIVQRKNATTDGGDAVFLEDQTVTEVLGQVSVVQILNLMKS